MENKVIQIKIIFYKKITIKQMNWPQKVGYENQL